MFVFYPPIVQLSDWTYRLIILIPHFIYTCTTLTRFRPPERTEHRLIVENLAHGVSWQVRT